VKAETILDWPTLSRTRPIRGRLVDAGLRRLAGRGAALVAGGLLTGLFLMVGQLDWSVALAGLCGLAGWAALWPAAAGADGGPVKIAAGRAADAPAATAEAADRSATWRAMLAGLADASIVMDGEGMVIAANAAARDWFPASSGRHISQLTRSPELLTAVDRALATGRAQACRTRMVVPVERQVAGLITPLARPPHADGVPVLLLVLRDLTEQERLARMRADFVANASHELRTPLASLKGFVETLQGAAKDDPAARERFLDIMQQQAARMSRLIDDLLSLSRIEMREHVPPQSVIELGGIVAETCRALEPLAREARTSLSFASPTGRMMVLGDRDELLQLGQNLIQNAIKYGKPDGHVSVGLHKQGNRIALSVADDGIGISPEHLPRLTERFYRVSAKDSRERGGTGLGLAIVKHIVNRHNGELNIVSRTAEGSTFTVLLPSLADPGEIEQPLS